MYHVANKLIKPAVMTVSIGKVTYSLNFDNLKSQ